MHMTNTPDSASRISIAELMLEEVSPRATRLSDRSIATASHQEKRMIRWDVFYWQLTDADKSCLDKEIDRCITGIRDGLPSGLNRLEIRELIDISNTANGLGLLQIGKNDQKLIYMGMLVQYKLPEKHITQYRQKAEQILQYILQAMQDQWFFLIKESNEPDDILLKNLTFGSTQGNEGLVKKVWDNTKSILDIT